MTVPHWRATTSPARPTSSRRSRGWTASTSCPRRCRAAAAPSGRLTPAQRLRRRAEDVLVGRGLHEIVGWSFDAPDVADRCGCGRRPAPRVVRSRTR